MHDFDIDRLGLPRVYTAVLVDGDTGSVPGTIAGYANTRNADGVDTLYALVELDQPASLDLPDPRDTLVVSIIAVLPERVRV